MHAINRRKNDLLAYRPSVTMDVEELNQYWENVLNSYAERPLDVKRQTVETPITTVRTERLTYKGGDDTPIHGLYIVPQQGLNGAKLPCVVIYQGYTGDKGLPERYAAWLLLGYAVFAVDARGQGGETGNLLTSDEGFVKGWVSQGITNTERSYYQAITMDAVRAVDTAALQDEVDESRIAVVGASQGGGLSLLAAALNSKVSAVVADIPNMCHMDFGLMNSTSSLTEIAQYIKRYPERLNAVLSTLAHFDLLNLAERIKAPVLMSVGWKDTVCMPETIYAVYNRIRSLKQLNDYPFSGHEVSEYQNRESILFLQEALKNGLKPSIDAIEQQDKN
ncbi:acetylesterase [Paenibacillus sp. FSL A5-0031]|uniref:acetylxylan esterase n=1 Tax=Paenibacillus sp. FSL A5-0031 TaxID=1920420 RepID=UPI00096E0C90|nr:alpha/beta fold hydrolase [Paenibacillus sp. FSL A5-0031]OME84095.1 acetylesterase [Paenibacillus sp. FSL A5-0031]